MQEILIEMSDIKKALKSMNDSIVHANTDNTHHLSLVNDSLLHIETLVNCISQKLLLINIKQVLSETKIERDIAPHIIEPENQPNQKKQYSEYLTEKQVSEITGFALSTLRNHRFVRKGIEYLKIGKSIRYSYETVKKYMEENRIKYY